jgi:hypothetical protein
MQVMALVVAIVFLVIAVLAMFLYSATPHGGPTIVCGPINAFGHTFNPQADCRYISIGELVIAGAFFFLAILLALAARPRR